MRARLFDDPGAPAGRIIQFCKGLRQRPEFGYPAAFSFIGLAIVMQWLARDQYAGAPFLTIYPAIILSTLIGGLGPGFVAAILAGVSQFGVFIPGLRPLALATYTFDATICVMLVVFINRTLDLLLANIEHEKQAKQHQRLLAAELHHRIQNLFTVIQAVVRFSLPGDAMVAEAEIRQRLMNCLQSMSSTNRAITDSLGDGVRLIDLIDSEIGGFRQRFEISGAAGIALNAQMTQNFALILHELITNALKYGALSLPQGRVAMRFDRTPSALHFAWQEFDGPPVEAPIRKSFGSQILGAFASGFCEKVDASYAPDGFCYALQIHTDEPGALEPVLPPDLAMTSIAPGIAGNGDADALLAWLARTRAATERKPATTA